MIKCVFLDLAGPPDGGCYSPHDTIFRIQSFDGSTYYACESADETFLAISSPLRGYFVRYVCTG
jgi:hypothetical protein